MTKSYKYGVYGGGTGNTKDKPATNGTAFATAEEAYRAGHELLARWTQPDGFVVYESDEPVSYTFPADAHRPLPAQSEASK